MSFQFDHFPCACRFTRKDEFSPAELVEHTICGYHASERRERSQAAQLSKEIHDVLKKRDDENHGLIGNLRCILDHVLR